MSARTSAAKESLALLPVGTCYLHAVIDGYSLVAYVEARGRDRPHRDRRTRSRARLIRCPKHHGQPIAAAATGPHFCCGTCVELGIAHNRSRPYRPQISGKIERFHRTLVEGWAFRKFYPAEAGRLAALPGWVHLYNHHRPHPAIGKQPPITRLNNPTEHHT